MNKLSLALAMGTGLALGTSAHADSIGTTAAVGAVTPVTPVSTSIQTLPTGTLTADQFNSMFSAAVDLKTQTALPVQTSSIDFMGSPGAGTLRSEVFQGSQGTAAAGLYAYAYQISSNNISNAQGEPVHIDGASWQFNATPVGSSLGGNPGTSYAYTISNGAVGGLTPVGIAGTTTRTPSSLSWQAGQNIGAIRADYVNPASQTAPLSGTDGSTFVILSKQPFSGAFQYAGVLSSNPQQGAPIVYSASGGLISPVPVPEPATLLAWAGMAGAVVLVRRVRKARRDA